MVSHRHRHIQPKLKRIKPKKRFYKKPAFWVLIVFITLLTFLYFILFYSKFNVERVIILNSERVPSSQVEEVARKNIAQSIIDFGPLKISSSSFFVVSKKEISGAVLNSFPALSGVIIKKNILKQSLTILVKERQPFLTFCPQHLNNCFFVDNEGIIFETLKEAPQTPRVKIASEWGFKLGEKVFDKTTGQKIEKIKKTFEGSFQIPIKEIFITDPLVFVTFEGWQAHFNSESNIDFQIAKLKALLEKEISKEDRQNLQYIYLQYEGRAYYK